MLLCRDISDRVRLEKEEATQAAVRKVLEFIPLCVTITKGPQHRIEQANRLARALVGNREIDGELLERVLPEARAQGFITLLDKVYASGETHRAEEMELRWKPYGEAHERVASFDLIYQPMLGDSGRVEGILHLGTDVTEKVNEGDSLSAMRPSGRLYFSSLRRGSFLPKQKAKSRLSTRRRSVCTASSCWVLDRANTPQRTAC